jgi:PAS domain S-box-containing protein
MRALHYMQRTGRGRLESGKEHSHTRRNARAPEPVSQNECSASAFNPIMSSSAYSPSITRSADDQRDLHQLEAWLAVEGAERERLSRELDIRNCALDAAATHFIIGDTTQPNWPVVYMNRAIARDYGYEPSELIGTGPTTFFSSDLNQVQLEGIIEAITGGHELRTELRARRKDGSIFWVGFFIAPVKDSAGIITHCIGIGADITARIEQDRIQRQLQDRLYSEMQDRERMSMELRVAQKLESVGRLAAGIAHEINTPIQYVGDGVAFLQSAQADLERLLEVYRAAFKRLAAEESPAAVIESVEKAQATADLEFLRIEVPKAFDRTLQGVERVAAIVRAMKEFAHPDANEHSPADLNHAIETTLIVAHNEYKYTATVETKLTPLPEVMCNVGELNQVFLNLIVNAAHAIQESGKDATTGRITIATARSRDNVVISVTDNGCGIPDENLEKVFDPFFTTKEVGRGTGQGLAIARSIVSEKHGGSIDVHSTVGVGTRFVVRLPIVGRTVQSHSADSLQAQ